MPNQEKLPRAWVYARIPGDCAATRASYDACCMQAGDDGCTVVGIPGTIVRRAGQPAEELNQVEMPDPVAVEMECLRRRIVLLENKLRELEKK